jgi:hypothetical protein
LQNFKLRHFISAAILDFKRHLAKKFLHEICVALINKKHEPKNLETRWGMVEKLIFLPFLRTPPF